VAAPKLFAAEFKNTQIKGRVGYQPASLITAGCGDPAAHDNWIIAFGFPPARE